MIPEGQERPHRRRDGSACGAGRSGQRHPQVRRGRDDPHAQEHQRLVRQGTHPGRQPDEGLGGHGPGRAAGNTGRSDGHCPRGAVQELPSWSSRGSHGSGQVRRRWLEVASPAPPLFFPFLLFAGLNGVICLDTIPVLAGQTVNDARGRYEITIDAAGRHYQQACIEIDGYLTQRKFSINEAFPADRKYTIKDFDWPKSARWQDSRTDINRVLNGVRDVRGDPHRVLNPTVPAQQERSQQATRRRLRHLRKRSRRPRAPTRAAPSPARTGST